jgi:hypothetical protein
MIIYEQRRIYIYIFIYLYMNNSEYQLISHNIQRYSKILIDNHRYY